MASTECPYCQKYAEFTQFPPFPGDNWLPVALSWIPDLSLQGYILGHRDSWDRILRFIDTG
jgi:hypothetical protein